MTEEVAAEKTASEVVCEGDRMASETAKDRDTYAKAPKINVRDFRRETNAFTK